MLSCARASLTNLPTLISTAFGVRGVASPPNTGANTIGITASVKPTKAAILRELFMALSVIVFNLGRSTESEDSAVEPP